MGPESASESTNRGYHKWWQNRAKSIGAGLPSGAQEYSCTINQSLQMFGNKLAMAATDSVCPLDLVQQLYT